MILTIKVIGNQRKTYKFVEGVNYMNCKTFEYDKVIVNVWYNTLPTKEYLEEPCRNFLRKVEEERQAKKIADAATSTEQK